MTGYIVAFAGYNNEVDFQTARFFLDYQSVLDFSSDNYDEVDDCYYDYDSDRPNRYRSVVVKRVTV